MNNMPFQSEFEENPNISFPKDYFDSYTLLKSKYTNDVTSATWEETKGLLSSTDPEDIEDALKILKVNKYKEALPYLAVLATEGGNDVIRKVAVQVIKDIGGREAKKILNQVSQRAARKTVDQLVAIILYDDDYAQRDLAIRKLLRRKSEEAKDAVEFLNRTYMGDMIREIKRV